MDKMRRCTLSTKVLLKIIMKRNDLIMRTIMSHVITIMSFNIKVRARFRILGGTLRALGGEREGKNEKRESRLLAIPLVKWR